MKRATRILSAWLLVLPVVVVLFLLSQMQWKFSKPSASEAADAEAPETHTVLVAEPTSGAAQLRQPGSLLGETILYDYANTNLPPENDLILMSRLMENSLLLLKSAANRPLSANEDWAGLFRGKNAAGERFLPDRHIALNPAGQLVDRWDTPLFFHALGGGRYEIRSAGRDGKLWTDDDLHRNADGTFRRGAALNPASLDAPR